REPEANAAAPERPAQPADEVEAKTFPVGDSGLEVTVAIPPMCRQRKVGHDPQIVAVFDCGPPGEPREGALAIVMNRQTRMTGADVESACHTRSEFLLRAASAMLNSALSIREASCDRESHKLVLTGTYRTTQELPEAQIAIVPTTEGLLGAVAMWRRNAHPST